MGPTVRPPGGAPFDRRPGVDGHAALRVVISLLATAGALFALEVLSGAGAAARTDPSLGNASLGNASLGGASLGGDATQPADHLGCPTCHAEPKIVGEREGDAGRRLFIEPDVLDGTPHRELTCDSCHPNVSALLHDDLAAEREHTLRSCAGCHGDSERSLLVGAHAPSDRDSANRPTCVTCHGAHDIAGAEEPEFVVAAAATCSDCHDERGKDFFERDYHGKQSQLGRHDTALCADCHGAHGVLAASDPSSPVHDDNVVETCRTCHDSAPENFGQVIVHVEGTPLPTDTKLRTATLYMLLILVGTFLFFGAHTALAIRHAWRSRPGGGHTGGPR